MDDRDRTKMKEALEACNKELEKFVIWLVVEQGDEALKLSKKKYPNIFKVYVEHNGLCDVMCNYFILINASFVIPDKEQLMSHFKMMQNTDLFNYEKMENLSKTHILSLVSFIELVRFFFFKTVPNNIFKRSEEKKLRLENKELNLEVMREKLDSLPIGSQIKFSAFKTQRGLPKTGHSMLISKVGQDEYMFFNPDWYAPQCQFYRAEDLSKELSNIAKQHEQVVFIDNQKFLQRVETKLFGGSIEKQKSMKEALKRGESSKLTIHL